MGKIVRRPQINAEKYVVPIPRVSVNAIADEATVRVEIEPPPDALDVHAAARAQAEATLDRARADAAAIELQAQQRAADIIAQSEARVLEVERLTREEAYAQGYAAGQAGADADMETMIGTMRDLIASACEQRHKIVESAEPELIRLSLAIAERIVHHQIAEDSQIVLETVRNALTRLVAREAVTLRVNPADLEALRAHRDSIVASNDVEHLRIVEDQRVDRGGVVIESESGAIDAKIATQLRGARRAIAS